MKIGGIFPFKGAQQAQEKNESARATPVPARFLFSQGQLVKGEVLGVSPEGKVLLSIGGQTIEAQSEVALRAGASLWLEVKQEEPLWLGLADKKGSAQEFLRQYFADPTAMGRGLRALLTLAFQPLPGSELAGGADFLQALAGTAVGREADVGQLLRLLSLLGGSPEGAAGEGALPEKLSELLRLLDLAERPLAEQAMTSSLHKLATLLELQRELNALPSPANQSLFLLFPCLFAMGAGVGQWLFTLDSERERGAGGPGYTLSFFLEMSRLGEVQVQVTVRGDSLAGEFIVGSESAQGHLEAQLPALVEPLESLGYRPISLSCRLGKTGLLEPLKKGIEQALKLEAVRLVDLTA